MFRKSLVEMINAENGDKEFKLAGKGEQKIQKLLGKLKGFRIGFQVFEKRQNKLDKILRTVT